MAQHERTYAAATFPRPYGYEKSFGRTFSSLLGRFCRTLDAKTSTTTYSETNI